MKQKLNSKIELINNKPEKYIKDSIILKEKEDIMIKNWINNKENLSFDQVCNEREMEMMWKIFVNFMVKCLQL